MEGITLETLKVVLEAKYSGYKKDMEQVKQVTKGVSNAVEAEKAKINRAFDSVSVAGAEKEINKLRTTLNKQREAVSAQEAVITNLKNKYQDLMSGVTKDTTVTSLEKQLQSAKKELGKLDVQLQPLLDKLTQAEEFEGMGLKFPGMDMVRSQIDEISPKYDELENTISRLTKQLSEVQLNPSSTTAAQKLQQEIGLAEDKLSRLRRTAADTEEKIDKVMNPKETIRAKIGRIITQVRQMGNQTDKTSSMMSNGFKRVSQNVDRLRRRITGLIGSALFFNVFSHGLTSMRESVTNYLKVDEQFSNALKATQTNLKVAFMPLYETALPYINAFMEKLSSLSMRLAQFTSRLFGKTYDESYKAAQGIEKAAEAMDSYGASSKKNLGLASFDELNNITTSSSGASAVESAISANVAAGKINEKVEKLLNIVKEFWNRIKEIKSDFTVGDFFKAGQDVSDLIVWFNNMLAQAIAGVDWKRLGANVGAFLRGLEWISILKSLSGVIWEAVKGAASFWFASFEEAPIETALITAIALWKFTKFGKIIGNIVSSAIPESVSIPKLGIKVLAVTITWAAGFEVGKEIGKKLFPDSKEYYDNFKWLGEGGFFDIMSNTDFNTFFDALVEMSKDTGGLLGMFGDLKEKIAGTRLEFEDLFLGLPDLVNMLSPIFQKWFEEDVQPWLTKEKWAELGDNVKTSLSGKWTEFTEWWRSTGFYRWWHNDVSHWFTKEKWMTMLSGMHEGFSTTWNRITASGAEILNRFIDNINEKLHLKWDAFSIMGKEIIPAGELQLFTIPTIPIRAYAGGGIVPSGQLFQARENGPELVGQFGSSTGVMNNEQIVESVSSGVESGTYRAISPIMLMLKELVILIQDMSNSQSKNGRLTSKDVFNMVRREAIEYQNTTGLLPFEV